MKRICFLTEEGIINNSNCHLLAILQDAEHISTLSNSLQKKNSTKDNTIAANHFLAGKQDFYRNSGTFCIWLYWGVEWDQQCWYFQDRKGEQSSGTTKNSPFKLFAASHDPKSRPECCLVLFTTEAVAQKKIAGRWILIFIKALWYKHFSRVILSGVFVLIWGCSGIIFQFLHANSVMRLCT